MPRARTPARPRKSPPKQRKVFRHQVFKSGAERRRFLSASVGRRPAMASPEYAKALDKALEMSVGRVGKAKRSVPTTESHDDRRVGGHGARFASAHRKLAPTTPPARSCRATGRFPAVHGPS